MNLFSILKSLANHPLYRAKKLSSIFRFILWQCYSRLNPTPYPYQWTKRAKLIVKRGMTGATGNLYNGLQDFEEMGFLLHFLRADDLFVDVGANIGSYTVLASAHVGCNSVAFEPTPAMYLSLMDNIQLNHVEDKVKALPLALGASKGSVGLSFSKDMMNNHIAAREEGFSIEVELETLDNVIEQYQIPVLLKIDVEGFETEVLQGASKLLQDLELKAIIIELMGLGARYGYDENKIHHLLLATGFLPMTYDPFKRTLIPLNVLGQKNILYVRDLNFVKARLKSAPRIELARTTI